MLSLLQTFNFELIFSLPIAVIRRSVRPSFSFTLDRNVKVFEFLWMGLDLYGKYFSYTVILVLALFFLHFDPWLASPTRRKRKPFLETICCTQSNCKQPIEHWIQHSSKNILIKRTQRAEQTEKIPAATTVTDSKHIALMGMTGRTIHLRTRRTVRVLCSIFNRKAKFSFIQAVCWGEDYSSALLKNYFTR